MRKIKASNVRIGDFVTTRQPYNGHVAESAKTGTVETIIHVGKEWADFTLTNGERFTANVSLSDPDTVWKE